MVAGRSTFLSIAAAVILAAGPSGAEAKKPVPPPPPPTSAVAYGLNAAHTGVVADAVAAQPARRWTVDLGGKVSYPLIVDGRVYVTVADTASYGSRLFALDAATGATVWGPVELGGPYYWSGLAYDGGRVFTVNAAGTMQAFGAATGTPLWARQLPGQYSFSSAPTATGGVVYTGGAGSGGTVYAVDGATGTVRWTAPVANGDNSSPAVSPSGVYVSYACGRAYDLSPATGAAIWTRTTSCSGGGGKTPVLANGRLYVRDFSFPATLDAATGGLLASFASSGPAPAVDATTVYDVAGGRLTASNAATGATRWVFGDGTLTSAPLVAGSTVFAASSTGTLFALAAGTGAMTWSGAVGAGVLAPDEQNVSQPLTGLATSGGLVVVPAGTRLVAFR